MDPLLGTIILFAGDFAPQGWALCNGQLLSISQNSALFAILGTTYGGDGINTFALPNLGARVPVGTGAAPGLTQRVLGETGGEESIILTGQQLPSHSHALGSSKNVADQQDPTNNYLAQATIYDQSGADLRVMNPASIGATGGNQPHDNMQPYLVLNYIIATQGIFPSRG